MNRHAQIHVRMKSKNNNILSFDFTFRSILRVRGLFVRNSLAPMVSHCRRRRSIDDVNCKFVLQSSVYFRDQKTTRSPLQAELQFV